jgi:hypothetical protein
MEDSCVFIIAAGRILLGTKTIAMEYDFMFGPKFQGKYQ